MNNEVMTVTVKGIGDFSDIISQVKGMQGAFSGLKLPANITGDMLKDFDKLKNSLTKFKELAGKESFSKTDLKNLSKLESEINSTFSHLINSFDELSGKTIYLEADATKIKNAQAEVDKLSNDIKTKLSNIKVELGTTSGGKMSIGIDQLIGDMERGVKSSKVLSNAMREVQQSLQGGNFVAAGAQLSQIINKAGTLKGASAGLLDTFKQWGIIDFTGPAKSIEDMGERTRLLGEALKKLLPSFSQDENEIKNLAKALDEVIAKKKNLETEGRSNLAKVGREGADAMRDLGRASNDATKSQIQFAEASNSAQNQVKQLQQSTQYFFSLRNMLNLLKRGLREAINVVKELDAAMTETAVVTNYSVGDMWAKLPEYTANANALGATVKDMYQATTLYYQQGLQTEAAMGIANETMKMARIGGLEAADATDKMTAALRGFNMEINEASAQRVNDVYSNLAAKTASNTEELGTAMQRTASIAASAGMSFEGTAAFLAQAIETTREPAENLGTAMKTIVARFTELKKNPLEITEVDGEEVDYNKVDTALKSIGVSLKDANGQFRNLDQVFLDISERWDSLTQTQQRYIATTAAGSRQQSRFIAMMSNYERTMQLMDYANNSSGASNEQFGKTMESLEAKLNKLQNAWNEFLMSIMNDSWTKGIVDAGTKVLNVVNKIIEALSFGGKAKGIKSALSIFTAFTALKGVGRLANRAIGGLGGLVDPTSSFKEGFFGGGVAGARQRSNAAQASAVYKPIVEAIKAQTQQLITGKLNNNNNNQSTQNQPLLYKDFIRAQSDFRNLFNQKSGFKIAEATSKLSTMSLAQQGLTLTNAPGMTNRMSRGINNYLQSLKLDKQAYEAGISVKDNLLQGMIKGQIPASDLNKILNPIQLGKQVGGKLGQNIARQGAAAAREYLATQEKAIAAETERRLQLVRQGDTEWTPITDKERQRTKNQVKKEYANNYLKNVGLKADAATKADKIQQSISNLGTTVTNTGQAFTSFGIILSNLGLSGVGTAFTALGTSISSVGMIITSIGPAITAVQAKLVGTTTLLQAVKAAAVEAGIATQLAWTGIGLAFVGTLIAIKAVANKIEKTAKENAEKVKDSYTNAIDEITKKESTLTDNKDRLNELAKGVDAQGRNISLTNDQYKEYIELSRNVADVAPELIRGYNEQGDAIIATGDAIDVLIDKQKKLREETIRTYTSLSSFKDVIRGFQKSDVFDKVRAKKSNGNKIFGDQQTTLLGGLNKAGLTSTSASKIIKDSFGRDINFNNLTTQDVKWISDHYTDIIKIIELNSGKMSEKAQRGFEDAFSNVHIDFTDVESELGTLQDQVQQFLSLYDLDAVGLELGEEFTTAFNNGLQDLTLEHALAGDYEGIRDDALSFAREFQNITGEGSKYKEILNQVQDAEEDYFNTVEEDNKALEKYQNTLKSSADELENFAKEQFHAGLINKQFYDILMDGANNIRQSATEPVVTLSEAINTLSDELSNAKGAYDRFSDSVKDNDYATAADSMSKIFEEVLDEKHTAGYGDNTFWTGSREILDKDTLNSDKKTVQERMALNQKMFAEGEEGWKAFRDRVRNLSKEEKDHLHDLGVEWDTATGMFKNIPDEAFSEFAKLLYLNDDAFAALLSKAQQWMGLDFSNMGMMKAALEQDERALQGTSGNYYMREQDLVQEIRASHPDWNDDKVADQLANWKKEGIVSLPSKETLSNDKEARKELIGSLKDLNIKNQSDLVKTLGKTGIYSKDDLLNYAKEAFGEDNFDREQFNEDWEQTSEKLENPQLAEGNATLKGIAQDVSVLAGKAKQDRIEKGEATEKDFEDIDKIRKDMYGGDSSDTAFQQFYHGKNINGEPLTKKEYDDTRTEIIDTQKVLTKTLTDLKAGYQKAVETYGKNSTEALNYKKRIDEIEQEELPSLDNYLRVGGTYFEPAQSATLEGLIANGWNDMISNLSLESLATPETQTKMQDLLSSLVMDDEAFENTTPEFKKNIQSLFEQMGIDAQEAFEQGLIKWNPDLLPVENTSDNWHFGNVTKENRPQGLTEDGKEVTVLGGSKSFSTEEGKEVEIAYTPVVTLDGKGDILEDETVDAYINTLINQLQEEGKEVNLDNLLELDSRGDIEGFEGIKNVIADVGDTATITAIQMHALEAGLDVETINKQYQSLSDTIAQVGKDADEAGKKGEQTSTGTTKSAADVQATTYEVFTAGAEGDINTLTEKLQYLKDNYPEVHSELIADFPQYGQLETYSEEIEKLDNKEVQQTVTASIATSGSLDGLSEGLNNLDQDPKITVSVDEGTTEAQLKKLNKDAKKLDTTKNLKVNVQKTGISSISVDGHTWTISTSAKGQNNKINSFPLPVFGSLAQGTKSRYGQVGPRNKGGLTLTGEKGFEIAWLPNENRSMILGAGGPQMIDLPSNAVVWTHEQSKQIIKRKAIPAGSHSNNDNSVKVTKLDSTIMGLTSNSSGGRGSSTKTIQKTSKAVQKSAEDAGKAVGKVSVWWENIARKTEVSQRNMDKSQKAFENYIKEMRSTLKTTGQSLKSGGGGGNDYIKNIGKYIGYYQAQLNKANKELKTLNTGKGGTQKQMKANYGGDGHENIAQISYKKGKKSKEEYVNLASYIKAENGTYVVDQKALNKEKNAEKRKAIADAANKEINDRLSKKYKAEDEIEKANEALKKMGEELYETFFKWENELTKIWNITQKIEQAQSRMSRNDAYGDLLSAQLSTGKLKGGQGSAQKDLANFRNKLKSQNQLLQNRQQAITESKKALQNLLTSDEEKATLAEVNSKLNKDNQATAKANKKAELDKAKQAKKNYDAAVKNRKTAQSKLNSVNSKIAKLEKKRHKTSKEKKELKNLKAQRTTYQNQIASYNKTISANKSLAGQVNKLQKQYNNMASGTALSATQRAGYEQYKKELENQIAAEDLGRKYTTITKRADGTIDVQFNTEAFEKARLNGDITNDMAKAVQDWVKKIQEASANLQENYENLIKDVTEYYTQLESLQDEWANYGKELTEITEDAEKQKIDKVKQLYDGVKKALDKLLDEVKRKLDERRKQEENAKTERDISQKQQRLAMLRADTSGGHQVEIAQLEQEIAEAQQNYQNSLEDQLVDKLQQQADLAAEQRERQIEIQEALATSVNNIEKVNEWMADPASHEDEIRKAYYAKKNYDNVTNAEQEDIKREFNAFYNGLLTNQDKQEELITQIKSTQSIVDDIEKALTLQNQTLETAKTDGYTAKQAQSQFNASLGELRTVGKYTFDDFVKSGYTNAQIKQAGFGAAEFKSRGVSYTNAKAAGYSLDELEKGGYTEATKEKAKIAADKAAADKAAAAKAAAAKAAAAKADKQAKYNTYINKLKETKKIKPANVKSSHINTLFDLGAKAGYGKATVLLHLVGKTGGSDPFSWKNIFKAIIDANGIDRYNLVKTWPNGDGTLADAIKTLKSNPNTYAEIKKHKNYKNASALKFATGGLADYTGLAWLDGTSSKPELVLNARDTKNFIMLKDVLSKVMDSSGGLSGFGGAAYEININVDHINSDYDVDKIAKRVKENIVKDSGYRNVTQVRKFR